MDYLEKSLKFESDSKASERYVVVKLQVYANIFHSQVCFNIFFVC